MKTLKNVVLGSAVALLLTPGSTADHAHRQLHQAAKKHTHLHAAESSPLVKRSSCAFPSDDGNLVAVTPGSSNAGWAMSPDQPCTPGKYCPIACKPGMVMAQWDPKSSYVYPQSMNGGLFCNDDGEIEKPFPDQPNCVPGTGTVTAVNDLDEEISWCQTVLPGNEAMLIPTEIGAGSEVVVAVPGVSYWASTAAHYYINPPGSDASDCVWGTSDKPVGNWAPYVAGANTVANGDTFVKIGWNPIFTGSSLMDSDPPSFGVKIECPGGGCNGLPCEISPGSDGNVDSNESAVGAGGASFCVVTVPKGGSAQVIAFSKDGGSSAADKSTSSSSSSPKPTSHTDQGEMAAEAVTSSQKPSSTAAPTTTTTSQEPTSTSAEVDSTTSAATSTSTSTSASTSESASWSSSVSKTWKPTKAPRPSINAGIFHENSNTTTAFAGTGVATSAAPTAVTTTDPKKGDSVRQKGSPAFAGLIVAFIAAAFFL